jgi:hypothetical protein
VFSQFVKCTDYTVPNDRMTKTRDLSYCSDVPGGFTAHSKNTNTKSPVFVLGFEQDISELQSNMLTTTMKCLLIIFVVIFIFSLFLRYNLQLDSSVLSNLGVWYPKRRSQYPRGLRHEPSSPAPTLGSWVQILLQAGMSVCVYSVFVLSCVGSGLATGWSPSKESYRLCIE